MAGSARDEAVNDAGTFSNLQAPRAFRALDVRNLENVTYLGRNLWKFH